MQLTLFTLRKAVDKPIGIEDRKTAIPKNPVKAKTRKKRKTNVTSDIFFTSMELSLAARKNPIETVAKKAMIPAIIDKTAISGKLGKRFSDFNAFTAPLLTFSVVRNIKKHRIALAVFAELIAAI